VLNKDISDHYLYPFAAGESVQPKYGYDGILAAPTLKIMPYKGRIMTVRSLFAPGSSTGGSRLGRSIEVIHLWPQGWTRGAFHHIWDILVTEIHSLVRWRTETVCVSGFLVCSSSESSRSRQIFGIASYPNPFLSRVVVSKMAEQRHRQLA
jgi:hypothetical protein